jgi:hypothetical protein
LQKEMRRRDRQRNNPSNSENLFITEWNVALFSVQFCYHRNSKIHVHFTTYFKRYIWMLTYILTLIHRIFNFMVLIYKICILRCCMRSIITYYRPYEYIFFVSPLNYVSWLYL